MTTAGGGGWGVRPQVIALCVAICAGSAVWTALAGGPEDQLVAGTVAALAAAAVIALWTMRHRLTAGPDGFEVRGPGGLRRFKWSQVAAISAPTRRRRGLASTSVELDLADDGLLLFGRTELGADPLAVAAELERRWRTARGGPTAGAGRSDQ